MKTVTGVARKENGIYVKLNINCPDRKRFKSAEIYDENGPEITENRSRIFTM